MITEVKQRLDGLYAFRVGKCTYSCLNKESLEEVRTELLQQMLSERVR